MLATIESDNYGACMSVSEELLCAFELLKVIFLSFCLFIAGIYALFPATGRCCSAEGNDESQAEEVEFSIELSTVQL